MKLIERSTYLEKLRKVKGTNDIKVLTGVRRCGKSKLLESFISHIRAEKTDVNVIHINFNLPESEEYQNYRALYDYVNSLYVPGVDNCIFIDEVQICKEFEKAINGLHAREQFDIYITGSNAFMLSSDLATLFTGRTVDIKVYPFSFQEFMTYFDDLEKYEAFERYMLEGGMAGSYLYEDEAVRFDYISNIMTTLITRDIQRRHGIRNLGILERIIDFLMDNISNLSSERTIANVLGMNHTTVGAYIDFLCKAYAFYKVGRYDIRGKMYLSGSAKYYLSDHSFRYARLGTVNLDYGRILENIVAIELLRRGYQLYVGVLYKKEIDFVAIRRSEKIYIQVSDSISESATFEREVSPLLQIRDAYPKLIIARTRHPEYQYEGVRIIDIADWLLS